MEKDTRTRFSKRTPASLEANEIARLLSERRNLGQPILDATVSNPTACGLGSLDAGSIAFADTLPYRADPQGDAAAREAIAAVWRPGIDPDDLYLTSSTSEAYSALIRVHCDPGDEVLVPLPSYPLIEHLCTVDAVRPVFYDHRFAEGWWIDVADLDRLRTDRTRMMVVVHPNNPTGHYLRPAEMEAIRAWCVRHGIVLVSDEVFFEYRFSKEAPVRSFSHGPSAGVPLYVLGGFSKYLAAPQWKLSWIHRVGGEPRAHEALLWILDLFLSVGGFSTAGAIEALKRREDVQGAILERIRKNWERLRVALRGDGRFNVLQPEAGWCAMVALLESRSDEAFCLERLRTQGLSLQPGSWFQAPMPSMVLSLLPKPKDFDEILACLAAR